MKIGFLWGWVMGLLTAVLTVTIVGYPYLFENEVSLEWETLIAGMLAIIAAVIGANVLREATDKQIRSIENQHRREKTYQQIEKIHRIADSVKITSRPNGTMMQLSVETKEFEISRDDAVILINFIGPGAYHVAMSLRALTKGVDRYCYDDGMAIEKVHSVLPGWMTGYVQQVDKWCEELQLRKHFNDFDNNLAMRELVRISNYFDVTPE